MNRLMTLLIVTFTCLSLFSTLAEAKRFGGGGSVGTHRSVPAQKAPAPASAPVASSPAAAAVPPPSGNRWLGPLAGLALGAGLGAMFAGGGLGGMMGGLLMALLAAGVVLFLISRFNRSKQPTMQYAGSGSAYPPPAPVQPADGSSVAPGAADPACSNSPAGFPLESFLRNAKTSFIRLQTANDRKDLNDIREYTTPEMFAEISMQLQERGDSVQTTDVVSIHAELLGVANEKNFSLASVRFTGSLRENGGVPESVDEIWHVQRELNDDKSVWLLAGIQQTNIQ